MNGVNSAHKHDMIDMLQKSAIAIRNRDVGYLKKISNYSVNYASTEQDELSVAIAVIVYALSKIIDTLYGNESPDQTKLIERARNRLEKIKVLLERGRLGHYKRDVKELYQTIEKLDGKLGNYIQEVLAKSRIKKGSKIYAKGIALGRTAELLGLTQWELMRYIGHTTLYDQETDGLVSARQRLTYAKKLFGL